MAQPTSVPHIGVLMGADPSDEATKLDAFRGALEKLAYIEGQTIVIEVRYAMGRPDRFSILAHELVTLAPSAIVCVGRRETTALLAVTRKIPVVFMQVNDPVEQGFVASLAQPGGNTTGFTQMSAELDLKRLQLLHDIAPSLSRATFSGIEASSSEALLIQSDPMLTGTEFSRILEFALAHRLPTIIEAYPTSVPLGVLLRYGPDLMENARLAAGYVDKILKGAKPADLPVQQPTKFVLVINLKTAKAIGLKIPTKVLDLADEVIE